MSNNNNEKQRKAAAEALGTEIDPFVKYEDSIKKVEYNPIEDFIHKRIHNSEITDSTIYIKELAIRQWKDFAQDHERHPTCPNDELAKKFLRYLRDERDNCRVVAHRKIRVLIDLMDFIRNDQVMPHELGYKPFGKAKKQVDYPSRNSKPIHWIELTKLKEIIDTVTNIRRRLIIMNGFKFLMRPGANSNILIKDININSSELNELYPELGTHSIFEGRDITNVIYIPGKDQRSGNKSARGRLLPIDPEMLELLKQYLLTRNHPNDPHLFPSDETDGPIIPKTITKNLTKPFLPKYDETDEFRKVNGSYGRHYGTTYWRVEQDLNENKLEYMRGDKTGNLTETSRSAKNDYIHAQYRHIKTGYLQRAYTLLG